MEWICKCFDELTTGELYELLALRCAVFIVEQQCPYQDIDGVDRLPDVRQLLGYANGKLVALARLIPQPEALVIGRVIVTEEARGSGVAHQLLRQALMQAEQGWPALPQRLAAQSHLQGFYARHGFVAEGEEFLEDDIPHIWMHRNR